MLFPDTKIRVSVSSTQVLAFSLSDRHSSVSRKKYFSVPGYLYSNTQIHRCCLCLSKSNPTRLLFGITVCEQQGICYLDLILRTQQLLIIFKCLLSFLTDLKRVFRSLRKERKSASINFSPILAFPTFLLH